MSTTSSRLLALLSLLQARRDWPGGLLAERLAVSPRTVRRDVDRLRELGYPIAAAKGPDGGYRLDAGTQLPPMLFDDEQAVALAVSLQTAAGSGADIEDAAARALATLRQVMPARLRSRIDSLTVTAVRTISAPRVDGGLLATIGAASNAHEVLRFDYATPGAPTGSAVPPRRAEPHHLVMRQGRWYLIGWDLDREDWRTFRVDRISLRTPNGPRFAARPLPQDDLATFVASRFRGAGGGGAWPCRGEVILARPVTDIAPYAGDAVVEEMGPNSCRVVMGAWSWPGLAATIGRFDADIEVIGPPALKEAFAELAQRYRAAAA